MHIGFFKNIEQYLKRKVTKNTSFKRSYFSYNPTNQNAAIRKYLENLENIKNIKLSKNKIFFY